MSEKFCKCGKLAHILYYGKCEDCWVSNNHGNMDNSQSGIAPFSFNPRTQHFEKLGNSSFRKMPKHKSENG